MSDRARRLGRAAGAIVRPRARRVRNSLLERAPSVAERLYRGADAVANLPFRREACELPPPLRRNGRTLDVVADIQAYTELPLPVVAEELRSRSGTSFRAEWQATPPELREDHWFYLSSNGYLFANAIHFPDTSFVERFLVPHVRAGGRILDFGAGTGNLALLLAASGYDVLVSELNALQRDFIRFRVNRNGLTERVRVLDPWTPLPRGELDAVVAVDVLEHLPACRSVLERELLPALGEDGVLVENSPFVVTSANPMHHEDFGLEQFLESSGFTAVERAEDLTRVWRRT